MSENEKDDFYDEDLLLNEFDEDEIFASDPDVVSTPDLRDDETKEDWEMTKEEDELFKKLLEKKKKEDTILKTFMNLEQRPSPEMIEDWKKRFGDVYLMSLNEKMNFIFRPLKRLEWKQLMANTAKMTEIQQADLIVQRAVVWPKLSPQNIQALTGGAPEALRDVILEASHFMAPERAMILVRQL